MTITIHELDKYVSKKLKTIPSAYYTTSPSTTPEDVDVTITSVFSIEHTNNSTVRFSIGHNYIHPYIIEILPYNYYTIEII